VRKFSPKNSIRTEFKSDRFGSVQEPRSTSSTYSPSKTRGTAAVSERVRPASVKPIETAEYRVKKLTEEKSDSMVRLNRYIAECGITSRRKADRLIESGQVLINGKKVYELGVRVDPKKDKVIVDGKPVRQETKKLYVLFFKPKNVVTTLSDPEGRACVGDYFKDFPVRLFPVGRLDWETEGLLLLTNDGDFANEIMHPKHEVTKTYLAKVNGQPQDFELQKLKDGVSIPGGKVKALEVEKMKKSSDQYDWIRVVISEGKNHQLRHMFAKIGYDVVKLQRTSIGRLSPNNLERGEFVMLDQPQLKKIFEPDTEAFHSQKLKLKFQPRLKRPVKTKTLSFD
jgi:23S rRNA pseudouridine2605 synthase